MLLPATRLVRFYRPSQTMLLPSQLSPLYMLRPIASLNPMTLKHFSSVDSEPAAKTHANTMIFNVYPNDLMHKLKEFNAKMEYGKGPNGTFKLSLQSHYNETKHIMDKQHWIKNKFTRIWSIKERPAPKW